MNSKNIGKYSAYFNNSVIKWLSSMSGFFYKFLCLLPLITVLLKYVRFFSTTEKFSFLYLSYFITSPQNYIHITLQGEISQSFHFLLRFYIKMHVPIGSHVKFQKLILNYLVKLFASAIKIVVGGFKMQMHQSCIFLCVFPISP